MPIPMHLLYAIIENGVYHYCMQYQNNEIHCTSDFVSGRGSFGRAAGNWTAGIYYIGRRAGDREVQVGGYRSVISV